MNLLITLIIKPIIDLAAKSAFNFLKYLIDEYKKDKETKNKLEEISKNDNAQKRAKELGDLFNSKL